MNAAKLDRDRRRSPGPSVLLAITTLALSASGCLTTQKTTIFDDGKLKVMLRSRGDQTRGFEHPVTISAVRLSHILARLDIRLPAEDGQKRVPGIPLETLDEISAALARGLAEAKPNQEVVVSSIRTEKHFGLFNTDRLTSFVAYQRDGTLFVHLSRSDWEVPPRREKRLPEPQVGEFPSDFDVLASQSMIVVDRQSLAIDWKAKLFDRPTRTRVTPDGRTVRRTILMESDEEVETEVPERPDILPIPAGVSPDVLRALADLEDRRRSGEITEAVYARERLAILQIPTPPETPP